MVLSLTIVALLLLLGLLCCVVLPFFLVRRGFSGTSARTRLGGRDRALEFAHSRFHLVDEPDVLVVPHHAGLRAVVGVPYSGRPQAHFAQVGGFYAEYAQGTDSAKNAMPNDMANLGCRTVPQMGCIAPEAQPCIRSH